MKYVALTGGIGSGKSHVARLFAQRGIPVFEADREAKRLMESDPALREALRQAFGNQAFDADGRLDRAYLAQRVFADSAELARLNALVHPAVHAASRAWHEQQVVENHKLDSNSRAPFALHEAAVVFENGYEGRYDAVILVTAPEEVRIERVKARDGASEGQIRARMERQWPDARKRPLATAEIVNDGRPLEPQIEAVIALLSGG